MARGRGLDARIVHPLRHPAEVALSLGARDGMSTSYAQLLWLRNVLDAVRASRGSDRAFVSYDAVLEDWPSVEDGLRRALGVTARSSDAGDDLLRPEMRHHRAGEAGDVDLIPEVAEACRLFEEAARSGRGPDPSALARLEGWLDSEALDWSLVGREMVARRTILEASTEAPDALIGRLRNEAEVLGVQDAETPGAFGEAPSRVLPPSIYRSTHAAHH